MPPTPLRPDDPQQVGPYRLTGHLGAGGMGIVYLARSRAGTPVALKLIRPEYAADPTFRARFGREVETGRRVQGVCIARFLDADPDADRPFLVTEYVDGPSLSEVVAARGPIGGPQLQALAAGLADGLVSLHRAGVVHRDLKPSNVLLARDAPKIIDFGIAHAGDATSMTRTGTVVGSSGWMAPEQATGQPVTTAADVFAWASTITYAATGRPPFGEGQPTAVLYRVVHEEPDLAGVPENLLPALAAAFAKDPASRPAPSRLLGLVTGDDESDAAGEVTRVLDLAWVPIAAVAAATAETAAMAAPTVVAPPATSVPAEVAPGAPSKPFGLPRPVVAAAAALAVVLVALAAGALASNGGSSTASTAPDPRAATTSIATTSTAPSTTSPPADPAAAWADVVAGLPAGTASTGILGGDPALAVTAAGAEVQVWAWADDEQQWGRSAVTRLPGPIAGPGALAPVRLTGAPRDDVLVTLVGNRGSVLMLGDDQGALVPFAVPDQAAQAVLSIDGPRPARQSISGSLASLAAVVTWTYDAASGSFVVEAVDPVEPAEPVGNGKGDGEEDDEGDGEGKRGGGGKRPKDD